MIRPSRVSSIAGGETFSASVIIPLYNKAPFIRRTLESVLAQNCPATEVVIVDDGSTDNSAELIEDLLSRQVRLVRKINGGPGPARNRGISEASGEWVAFLDADDIWLPNHLSTLRNLVQLFPEANVLATSFEARDAAGVDVDLNSADHEMAAQTAQVYDFFSDLGDVPRLLTSCTVVRREAISESGGFGDFFPGEDFELWARLALDHQIALSSQTTVIYMRQTGGLMDQYQSGPSPGVRKQPIFDTLDRALSSGKYETRYPGIKEFRQHLLILLARQAVYRGDGFAARAHLREHGSLGSRRLWVLRLLSWLPHGVLRAGIRIRTKYRTKFQGRIGQTEGRSRIRTR